MQADLNFVAKASTISLLSEWLLMFIVDDFVGLTLNADFQIFQNLIQSAALTAVCNLSEICPLDGC